MIKSSVAAGILAGALLAFAVPAQAAEELIAAPLDTLDSTTKALLAPILGPDVPAPAAAPKPGVARHRAGHHHVAGRHHNWHGRHATWRAKGGHAKAGVKRTQASLPKRGRKST